MMFAQDSGSHAHRVPGSTGERMPRYLALSEWGARHSHAGCDRFQARAARWLLERGAELGRVMEANLDAVFGSRGRL
jgi:hypothetical protein